MDHCKAITDYTQTFLSRFGFAEDLTVSVVHNAAEDRYEIQLQTADPSLIIGFHGETLTALQFTLGQHLHHLLGDWVNLTLNVNDYNQRRARTLYDLADTTVAQVLATKQPYALPPLTASERRLIHVYLASHPQVATISEGEGRSRTLIISPRV